MPQRPDVWYAVGRLLRRLLGLDELAERPRAVRRGGASGPGRSSAKPGRVPSGHTGSPGESGAGATRDLAPAEFARVRFEYAPQPDDAPDPGEVVWTWVPYVENDGRGKDRPVLIIGRIDEESVAACYVTTKQHRGFVSIGRGGWDPQGRESFLAPDRVLRVTHSGMRREGAVVERSRFFDVVRIVRSRHGSGDG